MINIEIQPQPNDETCGATCLQAIYRYYGHQLTLNEVIADVECSVSGGTLAPLLGSSALRNGWKTTIFINNLMAFDPTWFKHSIVDNQILIKKLTEQLTYKHSRGLVQLCKAYIQYAKLGGEVRFRTLDIPLLKHYFEQNIPILVGLNSTYLYRCSREYFENGIAFLDDIRGTPCGHFVILCGYDETKRHILVADPYQHNSFSNSHYYKVSSHQLINAILLGVGTYDAELLIVYPPEGQFASIRHHEL